MARSNNSADSLLTSARESAVHDGLRTAVPRYIEAVDALVVESRKEDAQAVLGELLAAKEKRRGFFLGKREQSALGNQRQVVAMKYAAVSRGMAPTENSLDVLSQLALEYPDEFAVRVANAEALRDSGYLLDAVDEYRTCKSLQSDDLQLDLGLAQLFSRLGRFDDAADVFAPMTADVLKKHRDDFEEIVAAFERSDIKDEATRTAAVDRLAACYEKLLWTDRNNQSLWKAMTNLDEASAADLRRRMDGSTSAATAAPAPPTARTSAAPLAQPVAAPAQTPAAADGAAAAAPAQPAAAATTPAAQPAAVAPTSARRPTAGGLSAFAKRKAMELFANSEYEAASKELERVVRMSPDVESLEMLLECYLVLDRRDEAARIGVQLADAELAAGNRPGAIATLTTLSKKIADPAVEQRRVELMQTK